MEIATARRPTVYDGGKEMGYMLQVKAKTGYATLKAKTEKAL